MYVLRRCSEKYNLIFFEICSVNKVVININTNLNK